MTNSSRAPVQAARVLSGIAGAFAVSLLIGHHPVVDAQQADGSQPPALVTFATAAGAAPNVAAPTGDGAATLTSLREDPNVSMLRIGHSAPEAVLQAAAFSLALTSAPGHTLGFRELERTDHPDGMVSLYARDPAAGTETAIVVDGQDVSGRVHDEQGNTWRLTPLGGGLTAIYQYDTSNFRMHPPGWNPGYVPELTTSTGGRTTDDAGAGQDTGDVPDVYDTPRSLPRPPGGDPGRVPELNPASREHITDDVGAGADTGNLIDVMVLYTRAARIKRGNINSFL